MAIKTPDEGKFTKQIEKKTAKLPSGLFLGAALTAMGASFILNCMEKKAQLLPLTL